MADGSVPLYDKKREIKQYIATALGVSTSDISQNVKKRAAMLVYGDIIYTEIRRFVKTIEVQVPVKNAKACTKLNELAKTPGRALYAVTLFDYLLEGYCVYNFEKNMQSELTPYNYSATKNVAMYEQIYYNTKTA